MFDQRSPPAAPGFRGALFGVCSALGAAFAIGLLAAVTSSCARSAPRPPILLVTLHGMRADVVGALGGEHGLTPHLDRFAAAADWRGRAVAPASAGASSIASLFTGLRPWQNQVLYDGMPLSRRYSTLPAVLLDAGYRTAGFTEDVTLRRAGGFVHGFEVLQAQTLRARAEVERRLCGPEPGFLWAHFDLVSVGYRRHDGFLDRLEGEPPAAPTETLPQKVTRAEIERWSDPSTPASPAERATAWALYRSGVAEADAQLGELLDALA